MDLFKEKTIILWDTEFTCWPGCIKNGWNRDKNQFREFIQIAMKKVDVKTMEVIDEFMIFVKPLRNDVLSDYCKELTDISQESIDSADTFDKVLPKLVEFIGDLNVFSFGRDYEVLYENLDINELDNPFKDQFFDLKPFFSSKGIPIEKYCSGTLSSHFGVEADGHVHDAMWDVESVLISLRKIK